MFANFSKYPNLNVNSPITNHTIKMGVKIMFDTFIFFGLLCICQAHLAQVYVARGLTL